MLAAIGVTAADVFIKPFLKVIHMRFQKIIGLRNCAEVQGTRREVFFGKIIAWRPSTPLLMNFIVDIFKIFNKQFQGILCQTIRFLRVRLTKIAQIEAGTKKQSARPIKKKTTILFWNFQNVSTYLISPQVKQNLISNLTNLVYELPQELPNALTLPSQEIQKYYKNLKFECRHQKSNFGNSSQNLRKSKYQIFLFVPILLDFYTMLRIFCLGLQKHYFCYLLLKQNLQLSL